MYKYCSALHLVQLKEHFSSIEPVSQIKKWTKLETEKYISIDWKFHCASFTVWVLPTEKFTTQVQLQFAEPDALDK